MMVVSVGGLIRMMVVSVGRGGSYGGGVCREG